MFKKENIVRLGIAAIFVLIRVNFRLLPHPPNFTPVAAIALFGGIYLSKRIAFSLPLIIMFISDIFIGSYEPKLMIFVMTSKISVG